MKSPLVIWLSLGLNLLLLAVACHFALRPATLKPAPRELRMAPTQEPMTATVPETNTAVPIPDPGVEAFSWAQLVSPDFKVYRDRLRAIGCPEETVRDIILAEINEKFRPLRAEILANAQRRYWEIAAKGEKALEDWETPLKKLDEEREALIAEVLGKDLEDEKSAREQYTSNRKDRYDWLSAEKQSQLVELELKSRERKQAIWEAIRQRPGGEATAEEKQKLEALQNDLVAARQQVLTPDEFLEYRLRNSGAGAWARNLPGFESTETEWRAVAKLKLEHQEAISKAFPEPHDGPDAVARRYGLSAGGDADDVSGRAEVYRQLQAELEAATKSALGPARFAEYELAESSDYQQTRRITERYQLPESLAKQTYELQRAAAAQAQAMHNDKNLSPEARASTLAAIRQETERTLTATLGPKVFSTYQEYHGNWLNQLDQSGEP